MSIVVVKLCFQNHFLVAGNDQLSMSYRLAALARTSTGYHAGTASELGNNWLVRIKSSEPTLTSKGATLIAENQPARGTAQLAGRLDSPEAQCCTLPYFTSGTGVVTSTATTWYDRGGYRNLSVVLERQNAATATADLVVRTVMSSGTRLEIPIRRTPTATSLTAVATATQSSTDWSGLASLAIDGNTDGDYSNGSVTQTTSMAQPWWEVDLGASAPLSSVKVWNRTDCCASRMTNFYVLVSNSPFPATLATALVTAGVTAYSTPGTAGTPTTVTLNVGQTGRYVRVWLVGTDFLHIAEVQVTGTS